MRALALWPACLVACAGAPHAPAAAPASPADTACAVWDRESSFAASVKAHDSGAFAEHVHPGAVFLQGDGSALRGREAIVTGWADIVRGEKLRLEWHPTSVLPTGDPDVALSRGPYWIELTSPDAKNRFLTGRFQSTWVRDADGAWRVLVDGGTPPPAPATEADVERIKASIPPRCPGPG